jgi:hypothetical protein
MNPSAANGVLKKAKLSEKDRSDIIRYLNEEYAKPQWVARHGRVRKVTPDSDKSGGLGIVWEEEAPETTGVTPPL